MIIINIHLLGKLKKSNFGPVSRVWKDKYVELRHGVLSYEDYVGWGETYNKKTLKLIATQSVCQPSKKYHGHVFEIRELDEYGILIHNQNSKKLFMAESNEDMIRWIGAIRTVSC